MWLFEDRQWDCDGTVFPDRAERRDVTRLAIRELPRLYVRAITVTVLVSLVASLPLVIWLVDVLVTLVMDRYSGNLEIWVPASLLAEVVAIGAAAYAAVAVVHIWRIRRVGLAEAMKVQE